MAVRELGKPCWCLTVFRRQLLYESLMEPADLIPSIHADDSLLSRPTELENPLREVRL